MQKRECMKEKLLLFFLEKVFTVRLTHTYEDTLACRLILPRRDTEEKSLRLHNTKISGDAMRGNTHMCAYTQTSETTKLLRLLGLLLSTTTGLLRYCHVKQVPWQKQSAKSVCNQGKDFPKQWLQSWTQTAAFKLRAINRFALYLQLLSISC